MTIKLSLSFGLSMVAVMVAFLLQSLKRRSSKLPPGPRKLPIIENLLDMPALLESKIFSKMSERYGSDIIHLGAFGQSIVILNSLKAAQDLLEKRSSIYSSRARAVMMADLCDWGYITALLPYGNRWRDDRRVMTKCMSANSGRFNEPTVLFHARGLIVQLLDKPEMFLDHIRHMVGLTIITTTYGLPVRAHDDPHVILAKDAARNFADLALAGTFLPDIFPLSRYLPSWIPGLSFHAIAKESRKIALEFKELPFEAARREMRSGSLLPSFVSAGLENIGEQQAGAARLNTSPAADCIDALKNVAATMFLAGTDTSSAVLGFLVFALVKNPHVQKKAQEELDNVLGGRLPTHKDIIDLPYLTALVFEIYRWRSPAPLGLPHSVIQDDVYKDYYIPKDTVVIANQEAMLFNEDDYPEPLEFKPERFLKDGKLNKEVVNPMDIAFGFGRRVCPGRHIAHSTIMITTATMLSALSFEKARDRYGAIIEPSDDWIEGIVRQPKPFECVIKPRSKTAEDMIRLWVAGAEGP